MFPIAELIKNNSRAVFATGGALALLGALAVASPLISSGAVAGLVGVALLAAGMTRIVFCFDAKSFGQGALEFLVGGFGAVVGGLMLARPEIAIPSLTIVLAAFFAATGIMSLYAAWEYRRESGWGWALFSGVVNLALVYMIGKGWPVSGVVAVGLYTGVSLMVSGFQTMMIGSAGDAAAEDLEDDVRQIRAEVRAELREAAQAASEEEQAREAPTALPARDPAPSAV